ncbi:nuclear transport factor 2 family protein [Mycolicibacterium komossense]|uniref:Nuclear transport factor 2 family protein n=1 Tax=Mycolicibacterium komossense TaxID=1779 RepID=A0ABT3CAH1_9MYCO|nr:nuclear transport factor 2 family protein [Mycolicibacterium komossense]MCV7226480.1 nuclear transport factor 2 family protein [Mycolicibacterium komossense]
MRDRAASPRTVVERYNYELWNAQKYAVATEIIGDEIVRNTPGGRTVLTHEQAVQRVRDLWDTVKNVHFTLLRVVSDDELCTIVYQAEMVNHDGTADAIAAIEVFRVDQGRIVEVWNPCDYDHDRWPEFATERNA